MRDFSLDMYRELLETLQRQGYKLIRYCDYPAYANAKAKAKAKYIILRHDVDACPQNSLQTAQIEHSIGALATYYFRCGPESNKPEIIRAIAQLGHEIGYHYEDLALCDGDMQKAQAHFETWLRYFRQYYAVETVCAHGSPRSRWDNKKLLKQQDYKALGITGEPYLDTDFSDVLYLTDTGRCWDGYKVSRRDKIPLYQDEWNKNGWTWHTTQQLIQAAKDGKLPPHVLLTTHPQRWNSSNAQWWRELVAQTIKNGIKRIWIKN